MFVYGVDVLDYWDCNFNIFWVDRCVEIGVCSC